MIQALALDAPAGLGSTTAGQHAERLMIVDDDPSVRHALWITFRDSYEVALAENGQKALDLFQKTPADTIVLDIRMPGLSGLDVLRELKQIDPNVQVILLSAYESVEYVREALRCGACDYFTKPYQVEALRAAVSIAMQRREVSRKTAGYDRRLAELQEQMHQQQMREELARTRNEIYASIIHDINGPLTVIAGYVELIHSMVQHANTLEEDQLRVLRSHASSISRQVANCIDLSRRYLGFLEGKVGAKSSSGIKEAFYDVAELLKAHPQAKSNELLIYPFDQDVAAAIHNTDLVQILLNLTINALQAAPHRHKVELYAKVISPDSARPFLENKPSTQFLAAPDFPLDQMLVGIFVQDNGLGIPESAQARIFEPYFTTKAPRQGTGLGLPIVRRLILQARGAIHVFSHPGEGTVFSIYLPIAS